MEQERLEKILIELREGRLEVDQALQQLRMDNLVDLGFATLDLQRAVRRGFPELVYGPGKSDSQIVEIMRRLDEAGQIALVTRVGPDVHKAVRAAEPRVAYHAEARALVLRKEVRQPTREGIVILTAGTSDQQVADEAALMVELMGHRPARIRDVGIAGLHRLLSHRETLLAARVIVAVAGMEGALPSVVTGLTSCPVIGVPTSRGYGAGGKGEAALMAMLNSCATGMTVVNIDNGFGAGYAAALINQL